MDGSGRVRDIRDVMQSGLRINGGYFVLKPEIFEYLQPGEELVEAPFQRLLASNRLLAYPYDGCWLPMDTFKDKQRLDELYARGNAPWEVWKSPVANGRSESYADASTLRLPPDVSFPTPAALAPRVAAAN